MIKKMKAGYEDLWKAIIRPPRDQYKESDLGNIYNMKFFHFKGPKQFVMG